MSRMAPPAGREGSPLRSGALRLGGCINYLGCHRIDPPSRRARFSMTQPTMFAPK